MALYKGLLTRGFMVVTTEKHFHDHDETWLILSGQGRAYWIDHAGQRTDFDLGAGDVWMIPAGYEHGSDGLPGTGRNSDDFTLEVIYGTQAPGSHEPGHYYMEREGYIPSLELRRSPTLRYAPPVAPARMKGIMFVEKGRAELIDEDTPRCEPGRVLCQTLFTGLTNGTERNTLMGGNYSRGWPGRAGYQNVGRVLAVGAGVSGFAEGDVVFHGDFQQHRQYFAGPAGADDLILKLPAGLDPRQAALFGVASVAVHDARRANLKLGERVLVVGAGLIGQFTSQAARACGAVVTVCDVNQERLLVARSLGAQQTVVPDADWANVKALGPFDCVFEDSGAPVLDRIVGPTWNAGLLRPRGRLVMIAGRGQVDYNFNAAQGDEIEVLHASHFTLDDLRETCRLVQAGALRVEPLLREVVPYTAMPALYDRLRDAPGDLLGVVFDWREPPRGPDESNP